MGSVVSPCNIFPLDISQFLMDTHHLNPTATAAYMHLLIHYWRHGALPREREALASIAHLSVDAWSIAQASLQALFRVGRDGLLHQLKLDRERAEWFRKRQKAKEKASKAANIRWAKFRDEKRWADAALDVAADHATGSPPSSLAGSPQTPFLDPINTPLPGGGSRRPPEPPPPGTGARPGVIPVAPKITPNSTDFASSRAGLGAAGARSSGQKGENKAKPKDFGATGIEKIEVRVSHRPGIAASRNTPRRPGNGHSRKTGNLRFGSALPDSRFEPFSEEIFAFWAKQNPAREKCPWINPDQRALSRLLKGSPNMTLEEFKRLLRNRAKSDVNPAALPRSWVGHIQEYAEGRLDRFKQVVRGGRTL
jgi:uncharacterized protein YdaU (DUF1376 family)